MSAKEVEALLSAFDPPVRILALSDRYVEIRGEEALRSPGFARLVDAAKDACEARLAGAGKPRRSQR